MAFLFSVALDGFFISLLLLFFYLFFFFLLKFCSSTQRTDMRLGLLQSSAECYRRAKDDFATSATEDHIKLLKCQVLNFDLPSSLLMGKKNMNLIN